MLRSDMTDEELTGFIILHFGTVGTTAIRMSVTARRR